MMKKMILLLAVAHIVLSCSLDRNNPLDPNVSGIQAPPKVTGLFISIINNSSLHVSWNCISSDVDGYYIYRSMSYNGFFALIKDQTAASTDSTLVASDSTFTDTENINLYNNENQYWYKMSAYSFVADSLKLEGLRSEPKSWGAK